MSTAQHTRAKLAKPKRPTPAQRVALENIAAGRQIGAGVHGRSALGGLTNTIYALQRAGWVDKAGITAAGRAAIAIGNAPA